MPHKSQKQGIPFVIRLIIWLAVIAVAAIWAIPAFTEWYAWQEVKSWVEKSTAELQASTDTLEIFKCDIEDSTFVIANHRVEWTSDGKGTVTPEDAEIRSDAFYVLPPGEWAKTPEEIMKLLRQSK
jgi:hypothetical protein